MRQVTVQILNSTVFNFGESHLWFIKSQQWGAVAVYIARLARDLKIEFKPSRGTNFSSQINSCSFAWRMCIIFRLEIVACLFF